MDDLKCKKGKAANKNNDLLMKVRRKVRKKRDKTKGKEHFKSVPKNRKPNIGKHLGRGRIKGGRGMEGMFFKGLRSEYISRESLNEANAARKKEDLNKIIDIGRGFLQRRGHPGRVVKRVAGCTGKREKSPEVSSECDGDFGRCPLSPIRFALTGEGWSSAGKRSLEEELERFSEKYEEVVEALVLVRLPEEGVLEDAVKALREMRIGRREEGERGYQRFGAEEFRESDIHFFNEFPSFTQNFERVTPEENFIHDMVSPERIPISDNYKGDGFTEKPLDKMLIMTDAELDNYHHLSFSPSFDTEYPNDAFHFQEKNVETSAKELNITTPCIQFYRRNMF